MSAEVYLNHPTFGLLFRICELEAAHELFATLYAQRLFFLVTPTSAGTVFEPVSRSDARLMVEHRLHNLRRKGSLQAYGQLQVAHKQTFS
ncbi:transcriptional coactivator PipX [Prochlorothrix hollandica]|uniref:Protein-PII uridylyltransferase n=1 Tax=Prochlorothrix hollandica PCC 9006 = CALU 1027 TaxID=317619 RepID=A0A0M2PZP5_PROHO|nr:PipX family protein [Prochlorothrix hollandica]KKI99851.1 protein-PII uridylyltransferase [Prochlorothrix hollandica PCC 9006 = CALU 1027]